MRLITNDGGATKVSRVRCRDLWAWERAVLAAELGVKGRVSARTVKAVALALRRHMNGPKKPDPGAGARPGTERLVAELGIARETIDRALAHLVTAGYLIRQVNGCRNKRAVYAAALPIDVAIASKIPTESVASTPHNQLNSVASTPHNDPECVARTPHLPKEVKTATTTGGEPRQLPLVAAVDGGGGTLHGDQTTKAGPALRAVAEALPDQLAAELLTDHAIDDIDAALTAIAGAGMPIDDIVDGCAARLPDVVGSIAALLLTRRIPTLQRRAAGTTRAGDTARHKRLANARRIGDQHALAGDTRDETLEHLELAFPDDVGAQAAGAAAYDATTSDLEQETG